MFVTYELGTLTGRLHVPIVGPTGRSDWSVWLVGPTIVSCKRFVRLVGQTVGCFISSDCRSDCRSVWTLRPTGRTDRPVGRPITLQRRRYLLLAYVITTQREWWLIS